MAMTNESNEYNIWKKLEEGVGEILDGQPRWWTAADAMVYRKDQWFNVYFFEDPQAYRSVIQRTRLLEARFETGFFNEKNELVTVAAIKGTFDVWNPALLDVDLMVFNPDTTVDKKWNLEKTEDKVRVASEFDKFFNGEPYEIEYLEYENAAGENL